jgi:hypothetical protein
VEGAQNERGVAAKWDSAASVKKTTLFDQKHFPSVQISKASQVVLGIDKPLHAAVRDEQVAVKISIDEAAGGFGGHGGGSAGVRTFQKRGPHRGDSVASG